MSPELTSGLAALGGIVTAVASGAVSYLVARNQSKATVAKARADAEAARAEVDRRLSGQVHTTDADQLWKEARETREWLSAQLLNQARTHREEMDRMDGELHACVEKHKTADAMIAELQEDKRALEREVVLQKRVNARHERKIASLAQALLEYQRQYGALAAVSVPSADADAADDDGDPA